MKVFRMIWIWTCVVISFVYIMLEKEGYATLWMGLAILNSVFAAWSEIIEEIKSLKP
jgi:hypothetical protein